jgi:LysM repeat protein
MTFKRFKSLKVVPLLLFSTMVVGAPTLGEPTTLLEDYYSPLAEQYIEDYHNFAVAEMERSAVLPSITLAQGMLESAFGTSELAKKANNHFGIKCHNGWSGEVYTRESNENVNGSTIARKSCFRLYNKSEESFKDHSEFLHSRVNYVPIFQAKSKDHKFWATKLQELGYATDPNYAQKLIAIIKTYGLDKYDKYTNEVLAFNNSTEEMEYKEDVGELRERVHTIESVLQQSELYKAELRETLNARSQELADLKFQHESEKQKLHQEISILSTRLTEQEKMIEDLQKRLQRVENIQQTMLKSDPLSAFFNEDGTAKNHKDPFPRRDLDAEGVFYQSGRKATIASKNRNVFEIAEQYNIPFKDLLKYNDLDNDSDLPDGYYVYLEPKANYIKTTSDQHQVSVGETIHTISQLYGIKLTKLCQRNHLKKGDEPLSGEHIFLNTVNEKQPKLKDTTANSDAKFGGGGK